jgi:hypothetical protein
MRWRRQNSAIVSASLSSGESGPRPATPGSIVARGARSSSTKEDRSSVQLADQETGNIGNYRELLRTGRSNRLISLHKSLWSGAHPQFPMKDSASLLATAASFSGTPSLWTQRMSSAATSIGQSCLAFRPGFRRCCISSIAGSASIGSVGQSRSMSPRRKTTTISRRVISWRSPI